MAVYANTPGTGSVIYGVNSPFKRSICGATEPQNILHLTRVKPEIVEMITDFMPTHEGAVLEASAFVYVSPNGMLRLENAEPVLGIELDAEAENQEEIELVATVSQAALLLLHATPSPLA